MTRWQKIIENFDNLDKRLCKIKETIYENAVNNKKHINELFHPLEVDVTQILHRVNAMSDEVHSLNNSFAAWRFDTLENDKRYADIIMIPYNFYEDKTLVIHHGKRVDSKNIKNLTLDWDYGEIPRLSIDK